MAHTQPEKFAAIEGLYQTQRSAPLVFFALPQVAPPNLKATIEVPQLLSIMAFGDPNAEIKGIEEFPPEDVPPLWMTFVSFHNMVILGMWFVGITALGSWMAWRGKLQSSRAFLWAVFLSTPLPLAAMQFGWVTAEVGRQPWIVYKLLRTAEAVSVTVSAGELLFSIILFGLVYSALLALYLFLLFREMGHGVPALPSRAAEVA